MEVPERQPSARHEELLEHAYRYVLENGLADMSLRPLAAAIGSSPRVLLFLFGSKDGLTRALLARARVDELALLERLRPDPTQHGLAAAVRATWTWLSDGQHRQLLELWVQAYARSLTEPVGPWADFARRTVEDWLTILASAQTSARRRTKAGMAERTLALAVLRGALLDLLATGDVQRTTAALVQHAAHLEHGTTRRSRRLAQPSQRRSRCSAHRTRPIAGLVVPRTAGTASRRQGRRFKYDTT
jgi:AcrR family transcriptional regulator